MCKWKPTQTADRDTEQNCHHHADAHECYNFTLYKPCRLGDSHAHKHTKAITHSVGGGLQCLDMECEDARVSAGRENKRKQKGCFWGLLAVSLCVGGWLWQLLFKGRTKKAAPSREGRTPLGWRAMKLTDKHMREHTCHKHIVPISAPQSQSSPKVSFFTLCCFVCCTLNTPLWLSVLRLIRKRKEESGDPTPASSLVCPPASISFSCLYILISCPSTIKLSPLISPFPFNLLHNYTCTSDSSVFPFPIDLNIYLLSYLLHLDAEWKIDGNVS